MGKLLFWLAVVFAVLFALRLYNAGQAKARRDQSRRPAQDDRLAAPMVRCASCGVFLPQADARAVGTGYRCNDPACAKR